MFGVPIFLAGLAALGLPVAIHLLARQRARTLPWGAMEFLRQSTSSTQSRRHRLRDLLLLLLRILAILLLVLTFAQPLASRLLLGGRHLETTIIWDISLSTQAIDETGTSIHETLRQTLLDELDNLPDDSKAHILLASHEPRWLTPQPLTLTPTNRGALHEAITRQQPSSGGSTLANAINTAISAPVPHPETKRNIVILHDGQRRAWQADDHNRWQAIQHLLAADNSLTLRAVTPPTAPAAGSRQLSIATLHADRDSIPPHVPVRFQATLHNHSDFTIDDPQLVWTIDGQEVARTSGGTIPPGEQLMVENQLSFSTVGSHLVTCEVLAENDPLPADNHMACAVSVPAPMPILIVDDQPAASHQHMSPSAFIMAALGTSPFDPKAKPKRAGSIFSPRLVTGDQLTTTLDQAAAVIIAGATTIDPKTADTLADFVRNGGGLWMHLDSSWETTPRWCLDLMDALGMRTLGDTERLRAEPSETLIKLRPAQPRDAFSQDVAAANLDLHQTEFHATHRFKNNAFLNDEVLLNTNTGHPALLSLKTGHGRVVLFTSDFSRNNTNLPLLQTFVPLVRETLRHALEGTLTPRNLEPGQPARLSIIGQTDHLRTAELTLPDGSTTGMSRTASWLQSTATTEPGTYALATDPPDGQTTEWFTVKRPPAESILEPISHEAVLALVESPTTPPAAEETARQGKWPLTWWFAVAAGLIFVGEALLAHWMANQRTATPEPIDIKPVF